MTDRIAVQPVEGRRLPRHDDPKRHVDKAMSVPNTLYYRRAIKRGDIAEAKPTRKKRATDPSDD